MSPKNKNQFIGYLLAVFMLFALINSAYFFMFMAKFKLGEWLAFNACSFSIIVYLVCFAFYKILKSDVFLAIALVPLYYYGTIGLFVIPWDAANAFAQVTHIIITLNVIWVLSLLLKGSRYESLGKGLLIGVLAFVPVFAVIQHYSQLHMTYFLQILQNAQ